MAEKRIAFLDYLRVIACFMVLLVHCCEQYYFNDKGEFAIASAWDAGWLVWIDSACRAAVPLFVMASAYLLFPVTRPTGDFFRRRLLRVAVPFAVWACVYNWANDGSWGRMLFNFPMATGGHLWFVPMLLGLYLLMPLLSPWAERVKEKELLGWLGLWGFTTLFPFLRKIWGALYGAPDFGAVPYLWGECPWNGFGMFQYVSGFVGYLLLGFWFRKFAGTWSWRKTLVRAVPLHLAGWALVALPFLMRIPAEGGYPVVRPYATAVDLEMSWEFCSLGVAMTVAAYFMVIRKLTATGAFYAKVVRPLAEASYGTYLVHILVLVPVVGGFLKPHLPTPCAIVLGAAATFALSSLASLLLRRIPKVGRFLG
ncbi:MAG: acyltransferase [Kiritimatiellae bacterium]|nr:acyltransferase [Kiritimatiellia bacterium]